MSLRRYCWIVVVSIALCAWMGCGSSPGNNGDANPGGDGNNGDGNTGLDCPGAGEQLCSGTCVNTQVDHDHCGSCDNVCGPTQVCLTSGCADSCPAPLSACDGSCVDRDTDNANCGTCGHACDPGMGCVGGSCVPEVTVGPDPAKCEDGGPPITVDPGNGTQDCTGNIVASTFTFGLCACQDVGVPEIDSQFYIDAFDSMSGPYVPGGPGGSCGADDRIRMSAEFEVTGDIRTSSATGLTVGGAMTIGQKLFATSVALNDVLSVGLDAIVGSFGGDGAPATIGGNLLTPDCGNVPNEVNVNRTCTSGAVNIEPPCLCGPGQLVDVASLVTYYSDPAHNDNALIGLDQDVYASAAAAPRLELPCGYYYLSSVNGSSERVIGVHGRTALFIGGTVSASAPMTFTLTPGSTLDVFVGGNLSTGDSFQSGSPAYPSHSRFWVAGSITTSASTLLNGLFYSPNSTFTATSELEMYGAIFTGSYSGQSSTNIHFDRAAASSGGECPETPPEICGATEGQPCQNDSDCCQPLACNASTGTCGYIIVE